MKEKLEKLWGVETTVVSGEFGDEERLQQIPGTTRDHF